MDTEFLPSILESVWAFVLIWVALALLVTAGAFLAVVTVRRQRRQEALRYGTIGARDLRLHDYEVDQLGYATAGFWLGVGFAGLAVLALLTAMLWLDLNQPFFDQPIPTLGLLGGFLTGGMAALFLLQAAQTRKLFDLLHRDRKITEAVRLVDNLADPHVRARAQLTIALQLSGVGALDVAAMQVLARKAAERQQQGQRRDARVYRVYAEPQRWSRRQLR